MSIVLHYIHEYRIPILLVIWALGIIKAFRDGQADRRAHNAAYNKDLSWLRKGWRYSP